MRKKTFRYILFACLACLLVAGFVLRQQFYGNAVRAGRDLYIGSRADYQSLTDSLLPRLRHHWAFGVYARRINLPETFKPGHYVLEPGMSVIRVARMLKLGLQTPVRVSINNARIPAQLAQKLARQIDADSTAIMQVLTSPEVARGVGFDSVTLFSMFIPNTYEFYWTVTPEEFVQRMKREYDRFWTPGRDALRERSGLSRLEVMTLASIVYEETRKTDEMPRIAGVYVNRLRKGMPLQADPTVKYAMQDFGLPLLNGVVPILALIALSTLFSCVSLRNVRFRSLVCGEPALVIRDGRIRQEVMHHNRLTLDALMEELRGQGVLDINTVKYAVLETSGHLSVLLRADRQPLTAQQMAAAVEDDVLLPTVVINDGRVMAENLRQAGRDENWLRQQLQKRKIKHPRDVFLLSVDEGGNVVCQLKEDAR